MKKTLSALFLISAALVVPSSPAAADNITINYTSGQSASGQSVYFSTATAARTPKLAVDETLTLSITSGSATDNSRFGTLTGADAGDWTTEFGKLIKTGAGTLTLSGAHNLNGGIDVQAGTLQFNGRSTYSSSAVVNIATGATLATNRDTDYLRYTLTGNGTFQQKKGTLEFSGELSGFTGTLRVDSGASLKLVTKISSTATGLRDELGYSGTGYTLAANIINQGTLTVNRSLDTTISGDIVGVGGKFVQGGTSTIAPDGTTAATGTTILTGTSGYTGTTTITSGTLQIGNGGTTGTLGFGDVINNATLRFARSNDTAVNSAISGSGTLVQSGTGVLSLNGRNTYTGATVIESGTIRINATSISENLQVMPVGDSITRGSGSSDAGYRGYLYSLLQPTDNGFSFVGSATTLPRSRTTSSLPADQRHHEGHGSYTINDILNNLDGNWAGTTTESFGGGNNGGYWLTGGNGTGRDALYPDVILLQIGTNDLGKSNALASIQGNLHNLLTKLAELRPDAKIILAEVTPRNDNPSLSVAYNAIVRAEAALFENVILVDLHTEFPAPSLTLEDNVHPYDSGYIWMANQWYNAIVSQYAGVSEALPVNTDVTIKSAGTLDLNGNQAAIASLSGETGASVLLGKTGALTINNADGTAANFAGTISGNGSVVKTGTGTQIFSGNNTYDGTTTIQEGKLVVNGKLTSNTVTVAKGAELGGNGTIDGAVVIEGKLAPGNSPGTLTIAGDVTLGSEAVLEVVVRDAENYSTLALNGGKLILREGAKLMVVFENGYMPSSSDSFRFITNASEIDGIFANDTFTINGETFTLNYSASGDVTFAAIPEPSTYGMIGAVALFGLIAFSRRRR